MGATPDEISTTNPYRYIDGLQSRIFLRAISILAPICPDILCTVAVKKHEGEKYKREERKRGRWGLIGAKVEPVECSNHSLYPSLSVTYLRFKPSCLRV